MQLHLTQVLEECFAKSSHNKKSFAKVVCTNYWHISELCARFSFDFLTNIFMQLWLSCCSVTRIVVNIVQFFWNFRPFGNVHKEFDIKQTSCCQEWLKLNFCHKINQIEFKKSVQLWPHTKKGISKLSTWRRKRQVKIPPIPTASEKQSMSVYIGKV